MTINGTTINVPVYAGPSGTGMCKAPVAPVWSGSETLPDGTAGAAYSHDLSQYVTGVYSPTFSLASGTLISGLSLSSAGILSGTPAASGSQSITVTATNGAGSATSASLLISIAVNESGDYVVAWESNFELPTQDVNGWSILTPSSDSRMIYVDATNGNDGTAQNYIPADAEIGADPYNPTGPISAYATISSAMAQARDGYPDYVLLKRGETWTHNSGITPKQGRSSTERSVIAYYGSATARPLVQTGVNDALGFYGNANIVVMGIEFYAHTRNPSEPGFVGFASSLEPKGVEVVASTGELIDNVLIEDCKFGWYEENSIQNLGGVGVEIVFRRNVIHDNYSHTSHSQGLYAKESSVMLEENIFDHNGWYQQSDIDANGSQDINGLATVFNHNTYFSDVDNVIFRRNIFMRASSMGNKWTSNTLSGTNTIKTSNVLMDGNFYVGGELGIGIGGNDDQQNGPRFDNIHIVNNVITQIGVDQPTGRNLGQGITLNDWDSGVVSGNLVTHLGDGVNVVNVYGLSVYGHTTDVTITDNIFYDFQSNTTNSRAYVKLQEGANVQNISFTSNDIQAPTSATIGLLENNLSTYTIGSNRYYSPNAANTLFDSGSSYYADFATYQAARSDSTSTFEQVTYSDPSRTIYTYLTSQSATPTLDGLSAEVQQQSKFNWRPQFTASAINTYMMGGY